MNIELYGYANDTLSDLLTKAAQARVFSDMVKDAKGQVDEALADAVRRVSDETGTAFTARADGWTAVLTDPQPKPEVTDRETFDAWFMQDSLRAEHGSLRPHVEVLDHNAASLIVNAWFMGEPVNAEQGVFRISTRTVLPEDVFGLLCEQFGFVVGRDKVFNPATGEVVPGVTVTVARQQLRVTGKTEAKTRMRAELHAAMGMKGIEA
jgi:hypothetical protein